MKSLIRLADRRGLLKGNLNVLQAEALQWLIIDEFEQQMALEQERMKYTILAANPQLWQELYAEEEDLPRDEDIEWFTPRTIEDLENVKDILRAVNQEGGEIPFQE